MLTRAPLKASVSLWSADLANLAAEIQRVEPYADLYHLDVSDGTYAPSLLLFFPDLVKAIRPFTRKLFEVHLITQQPERWVEPFAQAGADRIIFYPTTTADVPGMLEQVRAGKLSVGMSLALETPVEQIEPYLPQLDLVCVLGTGFEVKGVTDIASATYDKIRRLAQLRHEQNLSFELEADGAIRRHTVPQLRAAGVDLVVPGSLMFKENMAQISQWLRSL